jgi:branched-subunit amino acid aminotransferase/4-amino-4-deoxychorismate lyase
LPGVMRSLVLEHAQAVGLTATEATLTLEELRCAEVAFTTNSVRFLQPVLTLDGHSLGEPPDSRLSMLCAGVADRVRAECCYRLEAP